MVRKIKSENIMKTVMTITEKMTTHVELINSLFVVQETFLSSSLTSPRNSVTLFIIKIIQY